ncbi:hypothetical protein BDV96DRAFT_591426 [Lophiotrema nucula]|uniref:Uncharacterized protein n=1 Tax=Lophiotrema nucula TaxID=690887 RepID=A0A6A5YGT5_9PLEO|nr:hypothetical protein BDV96DRAFT_591426 [Lophiotrema nucula]
MAKLIRAGSCHTNGPTVYIEATLPNGGRSGYGRFWGYGCNFSRTRLKISILEQ